MVPTTPFPTDGKKYYRLPDRSGRSKRTGEPLQTHGLEAILSTPPSSTDPLGMYTGLPENPLDEPTQDADDL